MWEVFDGVFVFMERATRRCLRLLPESSGLVGFRG